MNVHPNLSRFAQHAELLVNNGWRPIPGYADTKRPSINGWDVYNSRQWEADELQSMIRGRGQEEGQVICLAIQPELVAIDIDIENEEQARQIGLLSVEYLGGTPLVRIGRHPRYLVIYRNDGSIRSRKLHPIEIFAGSGQIVGFGYHAKAGRDYLWEYNSPLDLTTTSDKIPIISNTQLEAFLNACWTIVERKANVRDDWVEPVFVGGDRATDRLQALEVINTAAEALALSPEGNRNNALFHVSYIAGQAIAAGLVQRDEAELIIIHAADTSGLGNDDGRRSIQATMRSGIMQGGNNPFFVTGQWYEKSEISSETTGETPVDGKAENQDFEFDDERPFTFPPSLIKGLLPRNGIAFIGGQSGAGKTFIAIDLAVALATGQTFFGKRIKENVGVLFVAGEGAETIQPRLTIARMARNVERPLPIAWTGKFPDFTRSEDVKAFIQKLKGLKARMLKQYGVRLGAIVVDTLAAVFALQDENDNSEASKIIRAMKVIGDALDVLILPIHHYGKGAETGLRGASAWRGGSDAVLSITAERNQLTGMVSEHKLWLAKSRVGEEGPVGDFNLRTMLLGVDEDGDELTSCYVVPTAAIKVTVAERRENEVIAIDMLSVGEWRSDFRSEQWAGLAIAEAFGFDASDRRQSGQIKDIIRRLISEKKLREVVKNDSKRMPKKFIEVVKQDKLSENTAAKDSLSGVMGLFD